MSMSMLSKVVDLVLSLSRSSQRDLTSIITTMPNRVYWLVRALGGVAASVTAESFAGPYNIGSQPLAPAVAVGSKKLAVSATVVESSNSANCNLRRTRRATPTTTAIMSRRAVTLKAEASSSGISSGSERGSSSNPALERRGGAASGPTPIRVFGVPLPAVLLGLLVVHKCATDSLSQYTRTTGVAYSATTASILGEAVKVPLLLTAIACFEGPRRVVPILKEAWSDDKWRLCLPGLAYAAQNVLYFMALSHISAASYQLLSQTKLLFTGVFMATLLGKTLGPAQYAALALLMGGSVLTQLSEVSRAALLGSSGGGMDASAALYGGALTVLGAALSALPNVYYEKVLKTKGQNQWAKNVQLTCWIGAWLLLLALPGAVQTLVATASSSGVGGGSGSGVVGGVAAVLGSPGILWRGLKEAVGVGMTGVTPLVWLVMLLQGFKCLLIPATLKYADNIAYAYAKPASILLTAGIAAIGTQTLPAPQFVLGAAAVFVSMWLYSK